MYINQTFSDKPLPAPADEEERACMETLLSHSAYFWLGLGAFLIVFEAITTPGLGLFLVALALIVAALDEASMALFLVGTVVGGVAVGAIFLGSLATANRLAPPGRRGQVVSTFFVFAYCGLIIPVIGVGVASEFLGDFTAVLALSILLAVLCLFSVAGIRRVS